ncbi:hypothetical protein GCM10009730_32390 [Streptomyces albidochromogenes]
MAARPGCSPARRRRSRRLQRSDAFALRRAPRAIPSGGRAVPRSAATPQQGVAVNANNHYFATEPPAAHLRLSFAATPDLTELDEGARRLAAVLRDHDRQRR